MSDFNKVAMLGYTLLTDSQKAAHFCTCTGCNHDSEQHPSKENSKKKPAMCITTMESTAIQETEVSDNISSCCTTTSETSEAKICQCNQDKLPSGEIALINTIDKTALLRPMILINFTSESILKFIYTQRNTNPLLKEIFRPPQ